MIGNSVDIYNHPKIKKKPANKIYEDSVEQMYIALPAGALHKPAFKQGVPYGTGQDKEVITNKDNINNIISNKHGGKK